MDIFLLWIKSAEYFFLGYHKDVEIDLLHIICWAYGVGVSPAFALSLKRRALVGLQCLSTTPAQWCDGTFAAL